MSLFRPNNNYGNYNLAQLFERMSSIDYKFVKMKEVPF